MGNKIRYPPASGSASKFEADEIEVLRHTWQELSKRSNGKGIDKETFVQYFPLNGLWGERLFLQFDTKNTGFVDLDEFLTGLSRICRGSKDEKVRFLFNMYDILRDNRVSKQEMTILLNHIPKHHLPKNDKQTSLRQTVNETDSIDFSLVDDNLVTEERSHVDEVNQWTNHGMIEEAFEQCDVSNTGTLDYEEFKMWIEKNPAVMDYIESILHRQLKHKPVSSGQPQSKTSGRTNSHNDLMDLESHSPSPSLRDRSESARDRNESAASGLSLRDIVRKSRTSTLQAGDTMSVTSSERDFDQYHTNSYGSSSSSLEDAAMSNEERVKDLLLQAMALTKDEKLRQYLRGALDFSSPEVPLPGTTPTVTTPAPSAAVKEGYLWKKGEKMGMFSKRFYIISGNCMYYYASRDDKRLRGVIFLTGCLVDKVMDADAANKGYLGLELLQQDMSAEIKADKSKPRVLYCRTEKDRDDWVSLLQRAAAVVPIEDDYILGAELGKGRFSVVREGLHKRSGIRFAVKIIEKASMEPEEKGLLRTEIAVLKLVNHPNIIKLEGLYENKQNIYIVMEKLSGGELFEQIVGRPRFSDAETVKLIKPLLESVAYLHDLGIVHRDLKPENILCGDNLEDLKIADFGLSKMTLPKEKMDAACGTLSYVAPEVLTMKGYGKEADLWSVGVIMFLLMCGKLPFDGNDQNEIIKNTIQAELKPNPNVWNKMSDESKSLIKSLLARNPKDRITAKDALKHPLILKFNPNKKTQNDASPRDKTTILSDLLLQNNVSHVSHSIINYSPTSTPKRTESPKARENLSIGTDSPPSTPLQIDVSPAVGESVPAGLDASSSKLCFTDEDGVQLFLKC